ncbi:hypothetical protein AB0D87_40665 [Streptomyces sp. NPDC048342]|uniref:hypothetical protein n=1 Tax=unclassified Streptomyces TaxID=2593676 RepID=UPI003434B923
MRRLLASSGSCHARAELAQEANASNSHFEGQAAGEVFNNTGKTDILVRILDTLRIKFGRIDSSEAPNTANGGADQLALSAAWADGLSLRKPLVPGLLL